MKKIISIILITLGLFLLLTPYIQEQLIHYQSKSILKNKATNEIIIENNQRADEEDIEYDFSSIENVNIKSVIKNFTNLKQDLLIGIIFIPDLDIELPIMKGLTEANLLVGAATMQPGQIFGQSNYTLAGHNFQKKGLLFGNLMDIELDTKVFISDGQQIYEYKIYETKIVPETAMEMLSPDRAVDQGQPILSLMTCYHSLKTKKRFFALGELVDQYPIE